MEVLGILEKKVSDLVCLVKELKMENATLQDENRQLKEKVDALETMVLKDKDELDQEKELTKLVVDGLIKSIDTIVEGEHQQ